MTRFRISSLFFVFALVLGAMLGTSCSQTGKKNVEFDTVNAITHEDTVRVFGMTKEFMDKLQAQQLDSAVEMLSYINVHDSAFDLTKEQKERVISQFKQMPVLSYEIFTSKFDSRYRASATYKYKFMENKTNDPNFPCTMNLTLDVIYKSGKFRLVLQSSNRITR